jgi:hypothetical protein
MIGRAFTVFAVLAFCFASCVVYPTEEEAKEMQRSAEGNNNSISLHVVGVPQDAEFIRVYVLPAVVYEREGFPCQEDLDCHMVGPPDLMFCDGGVCADELTCFDLLVGPGRSSVLDFSYAFVVDPELVRVTKEPLVFTVVGDEAKPTDLALDLEVRGLPWGRFVIFLEALTRDSASALARGCGKGHSMTRWDEFLRVRMTDQL